jgi:hypothetical protein
VKIVLYNMFVLYSFRFNTHLPGNKGEGDVQGFMTPKQFETFKEHFELGKWPNTKNLKGSRKKLPFHKGSFKQEVCLMSSLLEIKEWFTMFKTIKPKTEQIFIQDFYDAGKMMEIEPEIYYEMVLNDTYNQFVESNKSMFDRGMTKVNKCFLVVGERKGKAGNFRISYVSYPPMYGGYLRFHFCYQTEKAGLISCVCAPRSFPTPIPVDDTFVPVSENDYSPSNLALMKKNGNLQALMECDNIMKKRSHFELTRYRRLKRELEEVAKKKSRKKRKTRKTKKSL